MKFLTNPWRWFVFGIIFALIPLAITIQREMILSHGQEIVLQVVPVDPRSLFQGDYVRLRYEISRIDGIRLDEDSNIKEGTFCSGDVDVGKTVYVMLNKVGGKHTLSNGIAVTIKKPSSQIFLRGVVKHLWFDESSSSKRDVEYCLPRSDGRYVSAIDVSYGMEQFFVPEGSGRQIEIMDPSRIKVRVAVDANGQGVIKALLVDGKEYKARSGLGASTK